MNMPEKHNRESDNPPLKDNSRATVISNKNFDFYRFIEPSYIIALGTILFYLIVSEYYVSYFQRLSIPFYTLELPLTFFLYAGHWIAYSLLILILFIVILCFEIKENDVIEIKNHLVLIIIFFSILLISTNSFIISVITALFFITIISFYNIIIVYKNLEVTHKNKYSKYIYLRLILTCILIFIFALALPYYLGINSAENLIEKGSEGNCEVRIEFKEQNGLSDRTFLLITQSGSNYYLIEKNQSIPNTDDLYIIPTDQIKMISIKNKGQEVEPIYKFLRKFKNTTIQFFGNFFFNLLNITLSKINIADNTSTTAP
jgi:hypothetical protein